MKSVEFDLPSHAQPALRQAPAKHWLKVCPVLLFIMLAIAGCSESVEPAPQAELPIPTAGSAAQQAEAAEAARQYLRLIDERKYADTWDRTGSALKATTNELMWTGMLKASGYLRSPAQREIEGFGFSPRIDVSAPVGDYVMVQFKSKSGNSILTEKVVMQKEQGDWLIVGYFASRRTVYGADS